MTRQLLRALGVPDEPTPGTVLASTPVPARGAPSLARDALVCSIEPTSGRLWHTASYAVAGALLLELAHEGRLDVSGTGRKTRVTVADARRFGNDELDTSLALLASGGSRAKLGGHVLLPRVESLVQRLVSQGVLREESRRRLGRRATRRLEVADTAGRDEVVARIHSSLLGESLPDGRTALLISVFEVGVPVRFFVPRGRTREAGRRSREIREGLDDEARALLSAVVAVQDKNSGDYLSST